LLADGRNGTRTYELEGETVSVFIETYPPPKRLLIVGAVHIAIPLHTLGRMLGYHVTVIDARGMLATKERFPVADDVLEEWPDEAMSRLGLDAGTSVIVLAHDPKFDHPALAVALKSDAQYIGAIGSRGTIRQREEALLEMGFTAEQIARIHAPIGLDIGAQTPAEIALAVMAEVVAARYGRAGGHLKSSLQK
jgi:xanthine dehydrogenase accessory factor